MSSPSSIVTSIPTGALSQWCLVPKAGRATLFSSTCLDTSHDDDNNNTSSSSKDFQAFCCNGVIVNTALDIYNTTSPVLPIPNPDPDPAPVHLSDLLCCGVSGVQTAALALTPSPRTACAPGTTGTPLASLAATNLSRAAPYAVTYSSPAPESGAPDASAAVTNDFWGWATPSYGASGTPVCFLANTAVSDAGVAEVTVPATYVGTSTSGNGGPDSTGGEAAATPSSGAAGVRRAGRVYAMLGLMALGLFLL